MKLKQHAQRGFTLIELMIVVAIIGILAAVALPAYQDYTAKGQAAEANTIIGGLKTPIVEAISATGSTGCAKPTGAVVDGKYVSGTTFTAGGTAPVVTCKVEATFASSGTNPKIAGKKLSFTYDSSDGSWACASDLPTEIKPSSC